MEPHEVDQRVRVRGRGRIIVQSRTEIGAQREHGVETAVGGGGCDECVLVVGVVARLVEIVLEINPGRGKLFRVQWLLALHLAALPQVSTLPLEPLAYPQPSL